MNAIDYLLKVGGDYELYWLLVGCVKEQEYETNASDASSDESTEGDIGGGDRSRFYGGVKDPLGSKFTRTVDWLKDVHQSPGVAALINDHVLASIQEDEAMSKALRRGGLAKHTATGWISYSQEGAVVRGAGPHRPGRTRTFFFATKTGRIRLQFCTTRLLCVELLYRLKCMSFVIYWLLPSGLDVVGRL